MSSAPEGNYSDAFGMAFQRHALACVVRVPDIAIKYRSALHPSFFDSKQLQVICDCLLAHIDEHRAGLSRALLVEMVKEHKDVQADARDSFVEAIGKLYKEDVADAQAVASRLVKFGKGQALTKSILECAGLIEMQKTDDVLSKITTALKVGENIGHNRLDYNMATRQERADWYVDNTDVIPCGIEHVDLAMNGGGRRGETITIVGAAKKGKSTALINVGYGIVAHPAGYNVLHFTCADLTRRYVARRYDSRIAGPGAPLRIDKPNTFTKIVRRHVREHIHGRLIISEHGPQSLSANGIRRELDELMSEGVAIDALVVDYADVLKPDNRENLGKDPRHRYGQIYIELAGLTKERSLLTWTATQSNRASYKKDIADLEDVGEDISKVQTVDGIWTFNQTPDEKHEGTCRWFLAGYRNAGDGIVVHCDIDRARNYIASTSMELYKPASEHRERQRGDRPDRKVGPARQR